LDRSRDEVKINSSFRWKLIAKTMSGSGAPLDNQYFGLAFMGNKVDSFFLLNMFQLVDVVANGHVFIDKFPK